MHDEGHSEGQHVADAIDLRRDRHLGLVPPLGWILRFRVCTNDPATLRLRAPGRHSSVAAKSRAPVLLQVLNGHALNEMNNDPYVSQNDHLPININMNG